MNSPVALQPHGHASSGVSASVAHVLVLGHGTVWTSAFSCMKHLLKTASGGMDHCIEAPLAVASTLYVLKTWRSSRYG
jgi:hypothetical protein